MNIGKFEFDPRRMATKAALVVGGLGVVGAGYAGYELGASVNNASPHEVKAAEEYYLSQQAGYLALAGSDCERGVLAGLSVASENYYATAKSPEKTEEALQVACGERELADVSELAQRASSEFESLNAARDDSEDAKDESKYDGFEKTASALLLPFAVFGIGTAFMAVLKGDKLESR